MVIGGLQKFSLLDYPEHIAAVIFTQGCNFRCQFCYNPMLVWPVNRGKADSIKETDPQGPMQKGRPAVGEDGLFEFLHSRRQKLDGVVITGGEPTLHPDLPEFIKKIKDQGFKVKLDTNGTNPDMLARLIRGKLLDYIAMDVKGPEDKYEAVAGVKADLKKIKKSIKIIRQSGLPYEFRTTVVPGLLGLGDIKAMAPLLNGAEKWFLQEFQSDRGLVNPAFSNGQAYTETGMEEMRKAGEGFVGKCGIR